MLTILYFIYGLIYGLFSIIRFFAIPLLIFFGGGWIVLQILIKIGERRLRREQEERERLDKEDFDLATERKFREALDQEPVWDGSKEYPAKGISLGVASSRRPSGRVMLRRVNVEDSHRSTHMHIIGASESGKSRQLLSLICQDIRNHQGLAVIDPHGDLISDIKAFLAIHQDDAPPFYKLDPDVYIPRNAVVVVDPTLPNSTARFNPLEPIPGKKSEEVAGEMISIFQKIWGDSWGRSMEDILRISFIAICESGSAFTDLPYLLTDERTRRRILAGVKHEQCLERFREFEAYSERARQQKIEPVLNKLNALFSYGRLRDLLSAEKSSFNLREIMDRGNVLLVNLKKGTMKDGAELLGAIMVGKIAMTALARDDTLESRRRRFYLYVDEFQNFATDSFSIVLSEARKYGLSLIMAHQTLSQLSGGLQSAILGNCKVLVCFNVAHEDAATLSKAYADNSATARALTDTLKSQKSRRFTMKNKRAGALHTEVYTDTLLSAWDFVPEEDRASVAEAIDAKIGEAYFVSREGIRQERATEKEWPGANEDPASNREAATSA